MRFKVSKPEEQFYPVEPFNDFREMLLNSRRKWGAHPAFMEKVDNEWRSTTFNKLFLRRDVTGVRPPDAGDEPADERRVRVREPHPLVHLLPGGRVRQRRLRAHRQGAEEPGILPHPLHHPDGDLHRFPEVRGHGAGDDRLLPARQPHHQHGRPGGKLHGAQVHGYPPRGQPALRQGRLRLPLHRDRTRPARPASSSRPAPPARPRA